ncbi:MAG TPA: hypothetical protein VE422_45975 [Terriglobia bacterium]|nr:hypothetical protein [Terriglobia bacterium]
MSILAARLLDKQPLAGRTYFRKYVPAVWCEMHIAALMEEA